MGSISEYKDIVRRPMYEEKIIPYIGKSLIKTITGQRRVGKSYILKSLINRILTTEPESNIITINLEDFAFNHITTANDLHSEIVSRIVPGKKNCIFIDEIQEVEDFEKVVRSLSLDANNDIYVTGSNSKMLSSEISTLLSGRNIEIRIHPLSYKEFLLFHKKEDEEASLRDYIRYGGMPYLMNLPSTDNWMEYLSGLTDSIVFRDVIKRNAIRNTDFLQRLMLFLSDNIGQLINAKRIADYLKSQRITSSVTGVQNYISHITDAFIINKVRRWDIEGKRFFEIGEKYFFEDTGIRNSIVGLRPGDMSGLLENVVYNHLIIEGYKVKVGVLERGREIDFIAEKNGEIKYIQVAQSLVDEQTMEREFGNLLSIKDNYEKIVVTMNESYPNTYKGVRVQSLRKFVGTRCIAF